MITVQFVNVKGRFLTKPTTREYQVHCKVEDGSKKNKQPVHPYTARLHKESVYKLLVVSDSNDADQAVDSVSINGSPLKRDPDDGLFTFQFPKSHPATDNKQRPRLRIDVTLKNSQGLQISLELQYKLYTGELEALFKGPILRALSISTDCFDQMEPIYHLAP